jgi:hypothetical protein
VPAVGPGFMSVFGSALPIGMLPIAMRSASVLRGVIAGYGFARWGGRIALCGFATTGWRAIAMTALTATLSLSTTRHPCAAGCPVRHDGVVRHLCDHLPP